MARLVRKQVYLTEEQNAWVRRTAARDGRPEAEIIRGALEARMGPQRVARPRLSEDPLWDLVGLAASDGGGVSERVDEVLYPRPNDRHLR